MCPLDVKESSKQRSIILTVSGDNVKNTFETMVQGCLLWEKIKN